MNINMILIKINSINQKLFSYKFQTILLLSFLLEHFKIVFKKRLYHS